MSNKDKKTGNKPVKIKEIQSESKVEVKPKHKVETVILKNRTVIHGVPFEKNTPIDVTPEIRTLLKPFGYFKS